MAQIFRDFRLTEKHATKIEISFLCQISFSEPLYVLFGFGRPLLHFVWVRHFSFLALWVGLSVADDKKGKDSMRIFLWLGRNIF